MPQTTSGTDSAVRATTPPRRWFVLASLAASVSLIVIDGTIVNVALPTIIADLHLIGSQAEWVTSIYSLIFAALLIPIGKLADTYGRRRFLLGGLSIFVIASLLAGFATSPALLITARAFQGIGGAAVLPTTLSTVNATFRGPDRAIAFAVWGSVMSGMAAIGPLLGGWIATYATWHWIFFINIPLGVIIGIATIFTVPETLDPPEDPRLDPVGIILAAIACGGLVFGLIEGQSHGWFQPTAHHFDSTWPLSVAAIALLAGMIALGAFIFTQSMRGKRSLPTTLDLQLFTHRSFSWGNLAAFSIATGEFGLIFTLPLFMQISLGMTPIASGWILATMAAGAFLAGGLAAPFARRTHPATVATTGLALEVVGVGLLACFISPSMHVVALMIPLVIYGIGLGLASAQLTSTVLVDVPSAQSGQASATQSTTRQLGSALGIAIVGSALFALTHYFASTNPLQPEMNPQSLAQAAPYALWIANGFLVSGLLATLKLPRR
ncbi:MAG: MFS transporter [Actinomycetaceae bacterium]|nr:MFS transporter [Actinomycetaceae bacterium]